MIINRPRRENRFRYAGHRWSTTTLKGTIKYAAPYISLDMCDGVAGSDSLPNQLSQWKRYDVDSRRFRDWYSSFRRHRTRKEGLGHISTSSTRQRESRKTHPKPGRRAKSSRIEIAMQLCHDLVAEQWGHLRPESEMVGTEIHQFHTNDGRRGRLTACCGY